jgi:type IV pilus assembly protein PilP
MTMLLPTMLLVVALQPPAPIVAARDAKAKVEAAQQKNSDALQQTPPPSTPPPGSAQTPAPAPAPPGTAQPPSTAAGAAPAPPGGYTYDPDGRRDPFVSLLLHGTDARPTGPGRPPGLPGVLVGELAVKGILKTVTGYTALLQAPDRKTYVAHAGDRVMDGTIKSISQDAVVFSQDVTDPLSLVKQREVRKTIRPEIR